MSRGRFWCYTLNLDPDQDYVPILYPERWSCRYNVYSTELGESGNLHYQGYVEFDSTKRLSFLKSLDGMGGAHWEVRKGSQKEAIEYCKKVDDPTFLEGPFEYGEPGGGQGSRTDLKSLKSAVDEGQPDSYLFDNFFGSMLRYYKGINYYRNIKRTPRSEKTRVVVCWGPTGTGKSRYAHDNYPSAYYAPMDGWFDAYQGEANVICDEMYGSRYSWSFLLQLCDRYPMFVKTKGGFVNFVSDVIVFTSNAHPSVWYPKNTERTGWADSPLARRIDELYYFASINTPPLLVESTWEPPRENPLVEPQLYQ